jgi:zinc protease
VICSRALTPLLALPAFIAGAGLALADDDPLQVGEHTFFRRTLNNGLEALAVDDGAGGKVSVFVVYAAGNRGETAATTGLAHLTEHALFTGTARTPSGAHDKAIKGLGGESNAYTRDDYTAYYAHQVPAEALAKVLALEADRMRNLTWDEKAFLHERERLRVEELHNGSSDVQLGARRDQAVWAGRGYGAGVPAADGSTMGPKLTLAQARAFYDTYYRPRNASVVVVGAPPAQALDAIEAAFAGLSAGPRPPALATPAVGAGEVTLEAPISRERLEWVWVGPSLDEPEERLALILAAELCEGRKTADGSVVSLWQGGRVGPDTFVIASTGPQAADGVRNAYAALREGHWNQAAMDAAKRSLRDDFTSTPLRARPYFSLAVSVATLAAYGHADYAARLAERVDRLTRKDVTRAVERWLTPARRLTLEYRPTGKQEPLPDEPRALRKAAEAAAASGDLKRAITAYERLLTKRPGRVDLVIYRYTLGALNRDLGRLEAAREHLVAGLKVVEYPALPGRAG